MEETLLRARPGIAVHLRHVQLQGEEDGAVWNVPARWLHRRLHRTSERYVFANHEHGSRAVALKDGSYFWNGNNPSCLVGSEIFFLFYFLKIHTQVFEAPEAWPEHRVGPLCFNQARSSSHVDRRHALFKSPGWKWTTNRHAHALSLSLYRLYIYRGLTLQFFVLLSLISLWKSQKCNFQIWSVAQWFYAFYLITFSFF